MIEIREANIHDCQLIRVLASQTWGPTYGHILSPEQLDYMFDWMYSEKSLLKQMTEQQHRFFIASYDGQACGYISVEREDNRLFHIQKIYVLPQMQGKEIGKYLIEKAFSYIRSLVAPDESVTVELNVNRQNKATGFYKRMGFSIARSGDFPIGNGFFMNDYIMAIQI